MWKKRILVMIVLIILIGVALAFPMAINYYSDQIHMNKIQYVKSKDIDVFSTKNNSVAENIKILDGISDSNSSPGITEMIFEPGAEKLKTIKNKIRNEVMQWFKEDIMGLKDIGINLNYFTDFEIEDIRLMSLSTISFLEVTILTADGADTYITVDMDSSNYKIYKITIKSRLLKKISIFDLFYSGVSNYSNVSEIKKNDIRMSANQIAENIGKYYELKDSPSLSTISDGSINYSIGKKLKWMIDAYLDGADDIPVMDIGIEEVF